MDENVPNGPALLLRGMRISTRMYASIAALLFLFLLALLIACFGLLYLKANVSRYAEADRFATSIDRINRDIVELQRDVLVFSFTGNPAAPDRVNTLAKQLRAEIDQAQEWASEEDSDTQYRLDEMRNRLEAYLELFPEVVSERTTRRMLVEVRLGELEDQTGPAFERLGETVSQTKPENRGQNATSRADQLIIVERAMNSVALAQITALRFFNDPDVANVRATTALLSEASESLQTLAESDSPEVADQTEDLIELVGQYEAAFLRAVQATRGYLSLVNVVMAGEAAEFLFQSKQIQTNTERKTQRIASATVRNAGRSAVGVVVFAVVAILASIVVTTLAVRGIVNPISAMTHTFSQLMHGQNEAVIPGLQLQDEIGDMARAADMFRNRNRQTEQLLEQTRDLAEKLDLKANELARSNADLDSFAYVASHDLRSPLRAIDNIATWLEEDAGESIPDESRSLLEELKRRVRRMEQLLTELLDYSRLGREGQPCVETNLGALIEETVQLVDLPANGKIEIVSTMPTIVTDQGALTRVILNLLSNAIKYRGEAPLRIECRCDTDDNHAIVSITDNGIGIHPKYHERIFQMFKRLHSQSQIEGSGMGLALVKKLIDQAGGTISVDSEEGKGSTFRFTWPATPVIPSIDRREEAAFATSPAGPDHERRE